MSTDAAEQQGRELLDFRQEDQVELLTHVNQNISDQLRRDTRACRLRQSQFGTRKAIPADQRATMAQSVRADSEEVAGTKRLINTKHPLYKEVTSTLRSQKALWNAMTVPYSEAGIRLIKEGKIADFERELASLNTQLDEHVRKLNDHYQALKEEQAKKLGDLWNAADYPATLIGAFECTVEYPSLEPDERLMRLDPVLYQREIDRVRSRFDAAVVEAETEFKSQFGKCVTHLVDKLTPDEEGKAKVFRDTAIGNLSEFFERFRELNLHSDESFDQVVDDAQSMLEGVTADGLRKDVVKRQTVRDNLASLQERLESMLIDNTDRDVTLRD